MAWQHAMIYPAVDRVLRELFSWMVQKQTKYLAVSEMSVTLYKFHVYRTVKKQYHTRDCNDVGETEVRTLLNYTEIFAMCLVILVLICRSVLYCRNSCDKFAVVCFAYVTGRCCHWWIFTKWSNSDQKTEKHVGCRPLHSSVAYKRHRDAICWL